MSCRQAGRAACDRSCAASRRDRLHRSRQLRERLPARRCSRSTGARRRCGGTSRPRTRPTARGSGRWRRTPRRSRCSATPRRTRPSGAATDRYGGTLLQDLDVAGIVLNMMDDPRHARIRRLVSTGLTPRMVGAARGRAAPPHPRAPRRRSSDGVRVRLPRRRRGRAADAGDLHPARRARRRPPRAVGRGRRGLRHPRRRRGRSRTGDASDAQTRMLEYGAALIAAKRARPHRRHALGRRARHARPTSSRRASRTSSCTSFFSLLFAAGSETTRNAIAGGLLALIERPDQLAALRADPALLSGAIEEMLRWTTPSPSKRRTATAAHRARAATTIEPGDKVLFWEGSANRDERVFARTPWSSTSRATRTRTSRSDTACTTASAPTSPGSRCG